MKLSMFLLGNAFRMDSGKPPEKVKQVKEAKAFIAQVEKLRKARLAGDKKAVALSYAASIEALDEDQRDPLTTATHAGHSAARKALRVARDGGVVKRIGNFLRRIPAVLARPFGRKPGSKASEEKSEP